MSHFSSVRRWRYALILLAVHTTLFLLFTLGYVTSHDPNRGLLWVVPYYADMPASLACEWLVHGTMSLVFRVIIYLVFGGGQWMLVGMLVERIIGWD
jgi:hypothetical protein